MSSNAWKWLARKMRTAFEIVFIAIVVLGFLLFGGLPEFSRKVKRRIAPIWTSAAANLARTWKWLALRRRSAFWIAGIFFAVVLLIALLNGAIATWVSGALDWYSHEVTFPNGSVTHPNAQILNPVIAFLGGVILAWAAVQQARTATQRHYAQTKADLQRRITESFSKAIEQLGSDKLEVRLGAVYALERISKESRDDYWTVMETLAAFVRERSFRIEAERTSQPIEERARRRAYYLWLEAGKPEGQDKSFWDRAIEREQFGEPRRADVAAVLTVLKRRTECDRKRERENKWRFDFRGAFLRYADLSGVHLENADLSGSHLEHASLEAARLEHADLTGAHLEMANLRGACLRQASLDGAHLEEANLNAKGLETATILGTVHWDLTQPTNLIEAGLGLAHLQRAKLKFAYLNKAHFFLANLEGAELYHAHIGGAYLSAAEGLTQAQIDETFGNEETQLPQGLSRPDRWL